MSYVVGAINSVVQGVGGSTGVYGAWYEGEQQRDYYFTQAALTYREKQEAIRKIDMQDREAAFLQIQADYAKTEAGFVKKKGEIVLKQYQEQTDTGTAQAYAKTAASGVRMDYGSPDELIADVTDKRAFGYATTKFGADVETWKADQAAQGIQEKATIMLDTAKVNRSNLPMFDYQAGLFEMAGGEARRTARYKGYAIALNAISTSLSSFGGGGGGGEGGGGGGGGGE
jgi:hypothetical protein